MRANGATLLDGEPLAPGGEVRFAAPDAPGWVRAVLYQAQGAADVDPFCRPPASSESPIVLCSDDLAVSAMTSPLYLERAGRRRAARDAPATDPPAGGRAEPRAAERADEPDDDPALAPALQSQGGLGAARRPARGGAPHPRRRGPAARHVRIRGRRARWSSPAPRHDVQVRRGRAGAPSRSRRRALAAPRPSRHRRARAPARRGRPRGPVDRREAAPFALASGTCPVLSSRR